MRKLNKVMKEKRGMDIVEARDCSVIAIAIAARVNYSEAHTALRIAGRVNGAGVYDKTLEDALDVLGVKYQDMIIRQPNGNKYTTKTIQKACKSGYYIARTRTHFLAVANGEVEDWTHDKQKRVLHMWKITKPKGV